VIAPVGDRSANYSITGLWTAAQQKVPCTFVIVRNGVYQALKDYGDYLGAQDLPGMDLRGIDFVSVAAGYGLPARRVSTATEMADALKAAIEGGTPSLLEVEVEPVRTVYTGCRRISMVVTPPKLPPPPRKAPKRSGFSEELALRWRPSARTNSTERRLSRAGPNRGKA
jgi:TPP-dependent trihydroxycyclohexane-1,2-dione (THcHDO) dehydratase